MEAAALLSRGSNAPTSKGGYSNRSNGKRERPVCSHNGLVRPVVNKCYKIHGYPPRYKNKGKGHSANQVSLSYVDNPVELTTLALTSSQCQ